MSAPSAPAALPGPAKLLQVLGLWGLALAMSAALAAAGQRWPDRLPIRGDLILVLLLAPALTVVAWLLGRWRLEPASLDPDEAPRPDGRRGESSGIEQESL